MAVGRKIREWTELDRASAWILAVIVVVWLSCTILLLTGSRSLFLRDVLVTHAPYKAFGAMQLRDGSIPVFNSLWALGQPFRGNPNALPYYPGNLFYLVLPFWSAFNLHYALHWLLGFVSMTALARNLGRRPLAALMAGVTYALGGWFLSCLTFYNLLTVAAWWPLVLLGVHQGDRRGKALASLALGMALLGGEPLMVVVGSVPVVCVGIWRLGWRRGLVTTALAAIGGGLIALPQIVASLRILEFTVRGGDGLPTPKPGIGALGWARLTELIVPFPFGLPGEPGAYRFWLSSLLPKEPYFYTLYLGTVGLWLAVIGWRRMRPWTGLALAGLAAAWLVGISPVMTGQLTGGLFRYPEKFLFWFALAMPILAATGMERLMQERRQHLRLAWFGGAVLLVLGLILLLVEPRLLANVEQSLAKSSQWASQTDLREIMDFLRAHLLLWRRGLLVGGVLLAVAGLAARRRWTAAIVTLQLLALLQLYPIVRTMPGEQLRKPSDWLELMTSDTTTAPSFVNSRDWYETLGHDLTDETPVGVASIVVDDLFYGFGVTAGLSYPLAPDLEGIYSPRHAFLNQWLAVADWPSRINWLRILGVDYALLLEDPDNTALRRLRTVERFGVATTLYRVRDPAPLAWWPAAARLMTDAVEQLATLGQAIDPLEELLIPVTIEHSPHGNVEILENRPDRVRLLVDSEGGVLAVRRSYQPLFRAWSEDEVLPVMAVDYCLTGIVVPPGRREVVLTVSHWPENVASVLALLVLGTMLVAAWRSPVHPTMRCEMR